MNTVIEGIVLKETPYSETSKVIQVLSKEYGLISVIAKGASSLKSNLRSLTLPFLYAKMEIIYKKDKLSILKGGRVIKLYGSGTNDLKLYAYMSYLSELSYKVLLENNNKEIFLILKSGLDKLSENFDYNVIKNIIEFKYLDYLGITPDLTICHKCYERKKFYAIDGKIGGFVCKDCYQNERLVSEKFPAILNRFRDVDINEIKEIKISDENKNIVNEFLSEYYSSFSAIYLNSEKFLKPFE